MKRFEFNNPLSSTGESVKKIGIAAIGAGLLVESLTGCCSTTDEAERFETDIIKDPVSITICDGARVRDNPIVKRDSTSGETNLLTIVDYGDAPEGACLDFSLPEDAEIYRTLDPTGRDGFFIGMSESTLAALMPELGSDKEDNQNLVWINEQRAGITTTQSDDSESTDN